MFLSYGSLVRQGRPAFTHGLGQVAEAFKQRRTEEKLQGSAEVGRRSLDQKNFGILREGVRVIRFREKPEHHQVVSQHAQAPLRSVAPVRQCGRGIVPFLDGREDFQVDGGPDGAGALNRKSRFKKQLGGWSGCLCHGRTFLKLDG